MSKKIRKTGRVVLSVFLSATTALWLTGGMMLAPLAASAGTLTQGQITAILDLLEQFGADQSVVDNVQASLTGGTPTGSPPTGNVGNVQCVFTVGLKPGSKGDDVKCLQEYLNSAGFTVASTGAGSPGNETTYYGSLTRAAVQNWQDANGVVYGNYGGYFGPVSKAKYNDLMANLPPAGDDVVVGDDDTTPAPVGSGLTVSSGTQPPNGLAPGGAARVPFTTINFTASPDGDVTVNSVTVERRGPAANAPFLGVVITDENGTQIGDSKSLNSANQAKLTGKFTVKAGQTRTMTIGGNMESKTNMVSYAGQVAFLAVVGVDAGSAQINGTFPIVGANNTMNSSLAIGSVSMSRGSSDPGASQSKEVGTTGYTFSSIKISAGVEAVRVKSLRWNQSGSAGANDLENVVTVVGDTEYPTELSSDGKYYVAVLGDGIDIAKGFNENFSVKGDIIGGPTRTANFDIAKRTDINIVEVVSGQERYGITPPFGSSTTADSSNFKTADDPYYDAAQVTIKAGTMTVSTWTAGVPAQNIAVNTLGQPIMGLTVEVRGEPVTVQSTKFNFDLVDSTVVTATPVGMADLTNVTLVKDDGTVLASPVDGSGSADWGSITFTDTITWPIGTTHAILKAKLGTDFAASDTIAASTTPGSTSYWGTVKGVDTGNTVTPSPSSAITGPTQTVKAGALTVSVSTQPQARTIVAGGNQVELARYIFDAGQSGDTLRMTTIPLYFHTSGTRTDLTGCYLYDDPAETNPANALNANNVLNPATGDTASSTSLTFDGTGYQIPKSSVKTLSLRCNVGSGASGWYAWGIDAGQNTAYTGVSGVGSGQTVAETFIDSNGNRMTVGTGSYTVTSDTSVLYSVVEAGATDIPIAAFNFEAGLAEDITLKQIALELGNTASNSPSDLTNSKVAIWADGAQVGTAQFGAGTANDNATTSPDSGDGLNVDITRGEFKVITVKASFSAINAESGTPGSFIAITYDANNNGINGNFAKGKGSGNNISGGTSTDVTTNGVRVFRSVPTVEDVTTSTSLVANDDLVKVKVTAGSRAIALRSLTWNVATTGAQVRGFTLYGPSAAVNGTSVDAAASTGTNADYLRIYFDDTATDRLIQAGSSKTYTLKAATITGLTAANTETLSLTLRADTGYPNIHTLVADVWHLEHSATNPPVSTAASTTNNILWTPFSTSTPAATAAANELQDWTNSYGIPGFPAPGQNLPARSFKD